MNPRTKSAIMLGGGTVLALICGTCILITGQVSLAIGAFLAAAFMMAVTGFLGLAR